MLKRKEKHKEKKNKQNEINCEMSSAEWSN
jgi:hypothetical protein